MVRSVFLGYRGCSYGASCGRSRCSRHTTIACLSLVCGSSLSVIARHYPSLHVTIRHPFMFNLYLACPPCTDTIVCIERHYPPSAGHICVCVSRCVFHIHSTACDCRSFAWCTRCSHSGRDSQRLGTCGGGHSNCRPGWSIPRNRVSIRVTRTTYVCCGSTG